MASDPATRMAPHAVAGTSASEGAAAHPATAWPLGAAHVCAAAGAVSGLASPCVQVMLALPDGRDQTLPAARQGLAQLAQCLEAPIPVFGADVVDEAQAVMDLVQQWVALLAGALSQVSPMLAPGVVGRPQGQRRPALFRQEAQPQPGWLVFWPTHWPAALAPVLCWSLGAWHRCACRAGQAPEPRAVERLAGEWQRMATALKAHMPSGMNPPHLLAAAHALQMPVLWLDRETLQLGHGRRARVFQSTLTDATPTIGVAMARDKRRTNRLLHQLGLPVPAHLEVADTAAALAAARQLGWPVVVKPADQDRGDGARANLQTEDQLTAAFELARTISKHVLVEKHQPGREYRLTVVQGQLFWAHERVPATVTGDGRQTLQQLVDGENTRRQQTLLTRADSWMPIRMDEDNRSYLRENGRTLQDVPAAGEVVRLQRVPAATTGGGGIACFDTIHPDNRRLAERAAQMLRLDIAGVDVIMPDITRSWREVGGAVTEVNAIPQISIQTDPMLPQRLLRQLVPGSGRIPLLYVLADQTPAWLAVLQSHGQAAGLRLGVTTAEGLQVGGEWVRGPRASVWDDVRAMQMDVSVGAMVVVSAGDDFLRTGLPFDAIHALVVALHQPQVLALLLPYLRGFRALAEPTLQARYQELLPGTGPEWSVWAADATTGQIRDVLEAMLKAEAIYAPQVVRQPNARPLISLNPSPERLLPRT